MMKKKLLTAGAALLLLVSGILTFKASETYAGTLPGGISIEGTDLTGLSCEEASAKVEEQAALQTGREITLTVGTAGEVKATAEEMGFYCANLEETLETVKEYAGGNLLRKYLNQMKLAASPEELSFEMELDLQKMEAFSQEKLTGFAAEAKDASIVRENGEFVITESVTGVSLDPEATREAVLTAFAENPQGPLTAQAAVQETVPRVTTEMVSGITDLLGSFSTQFKAGNVSRTNNLKNGVSKINGLLLLPGEEFSAYAVLTPFTKANGYSEAGAYENGRVVSSIGGGACQICTTLYNAALLSELEITQRQNHSMSVSYVKPSHDSAIAGTVKDLKFKNSLETPIYIEGGVSGNTISFSVYGKETRPANREIQYVSETLSTQSPGEPVMNPDPTLAPGQQVREQGAHIGIRSRLWKYVYVDGVQTEKTLINDDTYRATKAIYRVGPALPAEGQVTEPTAPAVPEGPVGPSGPAAVGPGMADPSAPGPQPGPVPGPQPPAPQPGPAPGPGEAVGPGA